MITRFKLTNLTKIFFGTTPKDADNAIARLAHVNKALEQIPSYNTVFPYSGSLTGTSKTLAPVNVVNTSYIVQLTKSATHALVVGKKLPFADLVDQGFVTNFGNIVIRIGYKTTDWDGGDLKIYLGNSLVATVPAANLLNNTGTINASREIQVRPENILQTATGTFDTTDGIVMTDAPTVLNLRLTAETTTWDGQISITVPVNIESNSCGVGRCDKDCRYPYATIYCSLIKKGCNDCASVPNGGSFTSSDVVNA